jgi:hypothetical protein
VLAAVVAVRTDFSLARPLALAERIGRRGQLAAAGVGVAVVLTCVGVGLLTPSPLRMAVASAQRDSTGRLQSIDVTVHNRSDHTVHPNFVLLGDAQLTTFWTIEQGPSELQAGQTATYLLQNPGIGYQPTPGSRLRLEAVSDHPQTLSSVNLLTPR